MTCCNGHCPNEPVAVYRMAVVPGDEILICPKHIDVMKGWAGTIHALEETKWHTN